MNQDIQLERPQEAIDQDLAARPGVPHELNPPAPLADAHWLVPDQQVSDAKPLVGHGRQLTPIYSVANAPHGVSGMVRRLAYRIPDYRPRRWALLILADKIDVIEHNPGTLLTLATGAVSVGASILGLNKLFRTGAGFG